MDGGVHRSRRTKWRAMPDTRPDKYCDAVRHEFLRDLKSDSLLGACDQGDAFVWHYVLLYVGRPAALAIWSSSTMVSGGSSSVAAARFSRRWPTDDVPGMRSTLGARLSSHASATCIGVAPREAAAALSSADCSGENPPSGK